MERMPRKVWGCTEDDKYEFVSLTSDLLDGGLNVMREAFFKDENVAIACDVANCSGSRNELLDLCMKAAEDGVSLVAIEKSTGKVVSAAFNKLQVRNSSEQSTYFEEFAKNCKYDSSRALVKFMIDADAECDLFDYYGIDCLLEIMFLATLREHRCNGLGQTLCSISINLAKSLLRGEMVKTSIDDSKLTIEPIPKAVSAIFTSFITQKIGKELGFKRICEISYEKFFYKGESFGSKIEKSTPSTTLESLKL